MPSLMQRIISLCLPLLFMLSINSKVTTSPLSTHVRPQERKTTETDTVEKTDEKIRAMLRSPYLIEWFIDANEKIDLKPVWRLFNIGDAPDLPERCESDCSAETFELDVAGEEKGATVALRIAFERSYFYEYLIFKRAKSNGAAKDEWKLTGNIDVRLQQYGPPQHRIESGDGRTWFVIKELWGRGSGIVSYADVWYEITPTKVRRVLAYPVEGHDIPCRKELDRSYKSLLLRHELENGGYTVPIQFLVTYSISDCRKGNDSPPLFSKTQKAYFVWNSDKDKFVLDESRSDVTESELDSVHNFEGLTNERFVEYNFEELLKLAADGDAEQKDWLKQFLNKTKDNERKTALLRALGITSRQ